MRRGAMTPATRPNMLDPLMGALAPPISSPNTRRPSKTYSWVDVDDVSVTHVGNKNGKIEGSDFLLPVSGRAERRDTSVWRHCRADRK